MQTLGTMTHSTMRRFVLLLVFAFALHAVCGAPAAAQNNKRLPSNRDPVPQGEYYMVYVRLDEGELAEALKFANDALRGSPKGANGRYIDAICYHVAIGESLYKQGRFADALQQYDNALRQFLLWPQWPLKVDWTPAQQIRTQQQVNIPWGRTSRQNVQIANLGDTQVMNRGGLIPIPGGALQNAQKFPINAVEIIRATAIAMQRYRELSGPSIEHDPLVAQLDTALQTMFPPNHWTQCFNDILSGLVARMNHADGQAYALFERGRLLDGLYDHPLSAIAFYEMASIKMEGGSFVEAAQLFDEATYAQAYFLYPAGPTLLEQAFHNAFVCTMLANRQAQYAPMALAAKWAQSEKLSHIQATLVLDGAEASLFARKTDEAQTFLNTARGLIGRKDMRLGLIGARYNHLLATMHYQAGRTSEGDQALADALKPMSDLWGSHWLLHMSLADQRIKSGQISELKALRLYEFVLRDPTPADWQLDPLDAITVLKSQHESVYENWFDLALNRGDNDTALWIAEHTKRHRFLSKLPLGGRLLGLRWLLEGPADLLPNDQMLMKRDLRTQYPRYVTLSDRSAELQRQLRQGPWAIEDPEAQKPQVAALEELAAVSQSQEAMLREISVRREVSSLSFPPVRPTTEIRAGLTEGQLALIFFRTSRNMHVFQVGKLGGQEVYGEWRVTSTRMLTPAKTLLRDLGNYGPNRVMKASDLENTDWRKSATEIMQSIYGVQTMPEGVQELIVVPDGIFWYVPFEALQVPAGPDVTQSLVSKMRIRYAPTLGLMLPTLGRKRPIPNTAVVVGKLGNGEPPELAQNATDALIRDVPGTAKVPSPLPGAPAVYGTLFDRLVVFNDIPESATRPFGWTPLAAETGSRVTANLADWWELPFAAPQEVILPGYHTLAEDGIKSQNANATGDEMYLSVMGLMSCGSRTILLARWRCGGQTCYEMMREFVKELRTMPASEAWQRCIFLALQSPLDPDKEPRVNLVRGSKAFDASHPFFWAGYLVIDSGYLPPEENNAQGIFGADPNQGAGGQAGGVQAGAGDGQAGAGQAGGGGGLLP